MKDKTVGLTFQDYVAVITINNPPVNALSQNVRAGLLESVTKAEMSEQCKVLLIVCEGRTFVAGADISEFGKPLQEPHLPDVLAIIEACSKPLVVALHGSVLGGGLELALAAHYRIALLGTKVGLPEVTLGLIPGAGGTQRLPRLVGLEKTLKMITSGKPDTVENLLESGLIDKVASNDLSEHAIAFCKQLIQCNATPKRVSEGNIILLGDEQAVLSRFRALMAKKARGQEAPICAIEAIENSLSMSFLDGMKAERALFLRCRSSAQSRGMRHAFFAERAASKVTSTSGLSAYSVDSVGVIGAGTMGSGIAMCFASAGFSVVMVDTTKENLQRGYEHITSQYQHAVKKGIMLDEDAEDCLSRISLNTDYQELAKVQLVVEAAFESMQVKIDIFAKLDTVCGSETILATNTSYLDINKIAAATTRQQQVVGMHFFSPANVMKLLEVVRAEATNEQVLATIIAIGKRLGKVTVPVGLCYGFVGNRMYACYGREANRLLLEGASPRQIDTAMQSWGMAMGPLSVADMSGIDIGYKSRQENPKQSSDPQYFLVADRLVELGRLGRKTGAGFYRYDDDRSGDDPMVLELIKQAASDFSVQRRDIDDEEIQKRLIYALINEGCNILQEGIVQSAQAIDAIWLNGYGFPRYRGGPMCYADEVGLEHIISGIEKFHQIKGDVYWVPSGFLVKQAQNKQPLVTYRA